MKYPHPKIWLSVGLIFSMVFAINFYFQDELRAYFNKSRIEHVFESQAHKDGAVRVVLLCSSLGKQGLSDVSILNKKMKTIDSSQKYEFVKLPFVAARLEDFTENPLLLKKLKEYDPHFLVFQESYLFTDRVKDLHFYALRNTISFYNVRAALLHRTEHMLEQAILNKKTVEIYPDSLSTQSRLLSDRNKFREEPSLTDFSEMLKATIVVLEVPLPRPFEEKMDSIRQVDSYHAIFRKEKEVNDFIYFDYPRKHPFAYYYDESHMNDVGEQVYTDWFLRRLRVLNDSLNAE